MSGRIVSIHLVLASVLAACGALAPRPTPPAASSSAAPALAAPVTTTLEVFIALNPSPTPPASALPRSCQLTDLKVAISEAGGYCLAYPEKFTRDEGAAQGELRIFGPPLDNSAKPLQIRLDVTTQPVPPGSDLSRLVDAYLLQAGLQDRPESITRSHQQLGGEPAQLLADVPSRPSSRLILALHQGRLFTLRFQPTDVALAEANLAELFQTVTGSFSFLDQPARQ